MPKVEIKRELVGIETSFDRATDLELHMLRQDLKHFYNEARTDLAQNIIGYLLRATTCEEQLREVYQNDFERAIKITKEP